MTAGSALVLDLDQVGRVIVAGLAVSAMHDRDGLALEGDLVLGDREALGDRVLVGDERRRDRVGARRAGLGSPARVAPRPRPGALLRPRSMSMLVIRAWACGLRTTASESVPGRGEVVDVAAAAA